MAKTSYRSCWQLIQILEGVFGNGSFRDNRGYTMKEINGNWTMDERLEWIPPSEVDKEYDADFLARKEKFRKSVGRWRAIIYNEFGLGIIEDSTSGPDKHGNGGYYYYLANPELLDSGGDTLRNHIKFLADSETERDNKWLSIKEMTPLFKKDSSSMGFLSADAPTYGYLSDSNTHKRETLGHDNLVMVQFAMKFGEVLTIKYGKVKAGIDINAPYSFEPYQVMEIEGRWFAIGNLYPLGHKESSELAIYDLERMELAYDENPDFKYEPDEDFDINDHITLDAACKRRLGGVRAIDILTHSEEFAGYISEHPLCSAQEPIKGGVRIYINLTVDLIVMLGAYGDEMSIGLPAKDGDEDIDRPIIRQALNYFKKTEER